jgi:hypothetical protein
MSELRQGSKSAARVFMGAGQGNINLGDTPKYAYKGDQDFKIGDEGWSGEGDVCVAYVVKKA